MSKKKGVSHLWGEGWINLADNLPQNVRGDVAVTLLVVYPATILKCKKCALVPENLTGFLQQ